MSIPFQHLRETRRARADEAEHLLRLLSAASDSERPNNPFPDAASLLAWLAHTERIAYVAAPVTEPAVGFVAATMAPEDAPDGCVAPLLWVAPAHRRKGWGTKLAGQVAIWARRRGARQAAFRLPDGDADAAANSFAQARGWRLTPGWGIADLGD